MDPKPLNPIPLLYPYISPLKGPNYWVHGPSGDAYVIPTPLLEGASCGADLRGKVPGFRDLRVTFHLLAQRVQVRNNQVLGMWVIVIIVQVLGKDMTIRYLDP